MTRPWITYPVPLQEAGQPHETASVTVPSDLTRVEAERIREMLEALVLTNEQHAVIAELNRRVASCHERVACPTCGAPKGTRCKSMPRGWRPLDGPDRVRTLVTPHASRIRADGIADR